MYGMEHNGTQWNTMEAKQSITRGILIEARRRSLGRKMFNVNVCRPITGWHREVLFHENVAFAASTSLANGKWIVAGGITGNNSFYGGEKCIFRSGT